MFGKVSVQDTVHSAITGHIYATEINLSQKLDRLDINFVYPIE